MQTDELTEWVILETDRGNGKPRILCGRQGNREAIYAFTSPEKAQEFVDRHKPSWATATHCMMTQSDFEQFLGEADSHTNDQVRYFTVDPPANGGRFVAYSIVHYLRGVSNGIPDALEKARPFDPD